MTRVVCTFYAHPVTHVYDNDVDVFAVHMGDYICEVNHGTLTVREYGSAVNDPAVLTMPAEKQTP